MQNIRPFNILRSKYHTIQCRTFKISEYRILCSQDIGLSNNHTVRMSEYRHHTVEISHCPTSYSQNIRISKIIQSKYPDYLTSYHKNIRIANILSSKYQTIQQSIAKVSKYQTSHQQNVKLSTSVPLVSTLLAHTVLPVASGHNSGQPDVVKSHMSQLRTS